MSIRHDRDLRYRKSRNRKKRPKTFRTEEELKKYADSMGIKDYKIVNLKAETAKKKKLKIQYE